MTEPHAPLGVVLAGGASTRLGRDKAALRLDRETLLERTVRVLGTACDEVVIADRGRGTLANMISVDDGPGQGPAAGILGAAHAYPERSLVVLACDLPRITAALAERLSHCERDWLVPRHGDRLEPLCAYYGPGALAALESQVRGGDYALHSLLEAPIRIEFLEGAQLERFGEPAEVFLNVNTAADLEKARH